LIARAAIFLIGWNLYRYSAKNCLAQDEAKDDSFYKRRTLFLLDS
jgi:hypothetical protein